ncbi:hypothetical protein JAAARDRAFT_200928 [Jaapia argillacea MUCL 33604]|uniref:Uncharacterized protein n=1 Tax=Jaapia argillacea MUCL 33604 TaxID=933084 RepID=A0A067P686_9AGAM|nr:hypothetical protein JAAARDRAFT_200928 [Jaapia argillacea MUCL 33604]
MNDARTEYATVTGSAPPVPRLIQSFDQEITSEPGQQNLLRVSVDDPRIPFTENTLESILLGIDLGENRWWDDPKPTYDADPTEDGESEIDVPLRSTLKESTSESLPGFTSKKKMSQSKRKGKGKKVVVESPQKKLTITIPPAPSVDAGPVSDGTASEAATDFTTADQSDAEGMYNHVLMMKEKAKITAYQASGPISGK